MLKDDIGTNAGVIWQTLSNQGKLSVVKLSDITKIEHDQALLALGWLSRENKIEFSKKEGTLYVAIYTPSSDWYY